jgi:chromate transporter
MSLRIGLTGFGGPAAHVALLRRQAVERREWLDEREFLDLLGATSLLPGPGSTQMMMYVGRRRAGLAGLLVAGVCFILPAALLVLLLAWAYVAYGGTLAGAGVRYGLAPVVLAVVADAVLRLARVALRSPPPVAVGVAACAGYLAGLPVVAMLVAGGAAVTLIRTGRRMSSRGPMTVAPLAVFGEFVKLGFLTFGSGYVLFAFFRRDLVDGMGWITNGQLLASVGAGQLTPGPVFTAATFVGYLVAGVTGAALATVGIFASSFLLVGVLGPLVPRLRRSPWAAAAVDGVTAAALGIMAGVVADLARAAVVDPVTAVVAALSLALALSRRVDPSWLLLAGAAFGVVHALLS